METVTDFIFLASKITADGDCSHEIKTCLLLGRKVMTNLDSILKSRDIILPTKVHLVKAMVFPVVMHGCERWTVKKAEHRRIDAFELWCWRRLLRVPWTARRSNQSIVKSKEVFILPSLIPFLMLFLSLDPSFWPLIIFHLSKEPPLTFLPRQVYWQQITSFFVHMRKSLLNVFSILFFFACFWGVIRCKSFSSPSVGNVFFPLASFTIFCLSCIIFKL